MDVGTPLKLPQGLVSVQRTAVELFVGRDYVYALHTSQHAITAWSRYSAKHAIGNTDSYAFDILTSPACELYAYDELAMVAAVAEESGIYFRLGAGLTKAWLKLSNFLQCGSSAIQSSLQGFRNSKADQSFKPARMTKQKQKRNCTCCIHCR